jgi:hypothetical protein
MKGALNNVGVPKAKGGTPKTCGLSNRKRHNQTDLNLPDVLRSGHWGEWVYYLRGNKQCRRRYVVPKDPCTPNQLRCRAALAAASKAWSHKPSLDPRRPPGLDCRRRKDPEPCPPKSIRPADRPTTLRRPNLRQTSPEP